jgi:hypothetical protein
MSADGKTIVLGHFNRPAGMNALYVNSKISMASSCVLHLVRLASNLFKGLSIVHSKLYVGPLRLHSRGLKAGFLRRNYTRDRFDETVSAVKFSDKSLSWYI